MRCVCVIYYQERISSICYFVCRYNFDQVLEVMLYDDSSSDQFSSSEEDELDILLMDLAFAPKRILGSRITLQDIPEEDCECMFR